RSLAEVVMGEDRSNFPFVTPGICLACVAVTAAGLLKAATSGDLSSLRLAVVIALGTAYVLLLTVALRFVEQRGTRAQLYALLAGAIAAGSAAVAVSRGAAFLLLMPLVTCAVLFLSPAAVTGVIAVCTAVTVTSWVLQK